MKISKIAITFCLLTFVFLITACTKKESLSSIDFKSKMENVGYTVQDATDLYDAGTNSSVFIAVHSDFEILFHVLTNEENAKSLYTITKNKYMAEEKSSTTGEKSTGTYQKFTLKGKEKYKIVIRVDKTILLADVDKKYQKEIDEIVRKLKY